MKQNKKKFKLVFQTIWSYIFVALQSRRPRQPQLLRPDRQRQHRVAGKWKRSKTCIVLDGHNIKVKRKCWKLWVQITTASCTGLKIQRVGLAQIFAKIHEVGCPGGQVYQGNCQGVPYFGVYVYCIFIRKFFKKFSGEGGCCFPPPRSTPPPPWAHVCK